MSITLSDSTRSSYHTIDAYGTTRTCEKTNLIDIKALYGVCHFRDTTETTGTGTVTLDSGSYKLSISGASDSVILTSAERGAFISGTGAEVALNVQMDVTQLSAHDVKFGYYDSDDGFFFQMTSSGLTLNIRSRGSTITIPQSAWNGDFASSGSIPFHQGLCYMINYTYPFGAVLFSVSYSDSRGGQINRLLHSYAATGASCANPNLPMRVELNANGAETPVFINVGGRQFSVLGTYNPQFRLTSLIESMAGITSTAWTPISTYMKKTEYKSCKMNIYSCDINTSAPVYISFRCCTTLENATFTAQVDLPDCIPGASGLLRDTEATSVTSGIVMYSRLVPAGYSTFELTTAGLRIKIDERPFSIFCRALSSSVDVDIVIRVQEDF